MKTARHISALIQSQTDPASLVQAHEERIGTALVDRLLEPECLVSHEDWSGGRVYRVADHQIVPDKRWPMVTVGPDLVAEPQIFEAEAELKARFVVTLYFHEPRAGLGPDELSAPTFARYVWHFLTATPEGRYLTSARYQSQRLLSEPMQLADRLYGDLLADPSGQREQDDDGRPLSERYLQLNIDTVSVISLATGSPHGWTP